MAGGSGKGRPAVAPPARPAAPVSAQRVGWGGLRKVARLVWSGLWRRPGSRRSGLSGAPPGENQRGFRAVALGGRFPPAALAWPWRGEVPALAGARARWVLTSWCRFLPCSTGRPGSPGRPAEASRARRRRATAPRRRTDSTQAGPVTSISTARRGGTRGTPRSRTCVDSGPGAAGTSAQGPHARGRGRGTPGTRHSLAPSTCR